MSAKGLKKKYWAFVVYPESAPEDWRDILVQTGLECAISPLHDQDVNPDGTVKKAHYHVIACYPNSTTYNNVKGLTDKLNAPIPIGIDSVKGYYRYLTHADNPDKYQYDKDDIVTVNGFNIADFVELTKREIEELKREIIGIIRENNFTEYALLIDFLIDYQRFDLSDIASNNTIFFNNYISSKRNMQIKREG